MDRSLRWLLARRPLVAVSTIAAISIALSVTITLLSLPLIGALDRATVTQATLIAIAVPLAVSAPVSRVLLALLHQLEHARGLAEELARTDMLTSTLNRRRFVELAQIALASAPGGRPASLLLLDVDDFKNVNDRYGHQRGDDVLVAVAAACADALRPGDLLARWGGEEFVALLPDADRAEAARIAGRLKAVVAAAQVAVHPLSAAVAGVQVTVSIGMSCTQGGHPATLDSLLSDADHAMYRAKNAGKNAAVASWALTT